MLIKVKCIMKYSQLLSTLHLTCSLYSTPPTYHHDVFTSGFQCVKAYIHCILYISHRKIPSSKKHLSCLCRMQNLKVSSLSGIPASQPNKANLPYTNCDTASVFTSFMPWVASSLQWYLQYYQIETFYHITQSWYKMINWKYSPRPSITSQS